MTFTSDYLATLPPDFFFNTSKINTRMKSATMFSIFKAALAREKYKYYCSKSRNLTYSKISQRKRKATGCVRGKDWREFIFLWNNLGSFMKLERARTSFFFFFLIVNERSSEKLFLNAGSLLL